MLPDRIKPCITIYVHPHQGYEQKLREVQAGMEEEGVPYSILESQDDNLIALAYQAACTSKLGVGVGISLDGLAIQHEKLPAEEPLFSVKESGIPAEWRRVGYNAARLVKGIPFKNPAEEQSDLQCQDTNELYQLVWRIVQKILQETGQGHGEVKAWSKTH